MINKLLDIDKTQQAFALAEQGIYYFLSLPRQFGKSLFLDTLKCLFEARKHPLRKIVNLASIILHHDPRIHFCPAWFYPGDT
ncbi:AAA family ATPase [Desulfobacter sp.]|uniref:AAA family ATPase n=1 Tax=Desulfobacter sp. TaxID=2294 RepID=UPI003D12DEC7